jgi:hypothetical protein
MRPTVSQVCGDGLADIGRQRHWCGPTTFTVHGHLAGFPIDIFQIERNNFSGPQASLASSSKIAQFRRPRGAWRSQRFTTCCTVPGGRNLGNVDFDQLGTIGTQAARSSEISPRLRR